MIRIEEKTIGNFTLMFCKSFDELVNLVIIKKGVSNMISQIDIDKKLLERVLISNESIIEKIFNEFKEDKYLSYCCTGDLKMLRKIKEKGVSIKWH